MSEDGSKEYYQNANREYITFKKNGDNGSVYCAFEDNESLEKYQEYFNEQILSWYMIPTAEINNSTLGIKLSQLVSKDGLKTGKIVMISSVEPFSTQFSGIVVDGELNGYKIRPFGYITDVVANVEQNIFAKGVTNESGTGYDIEYRVNDDNQIKVSIDIPVAARNFTNLRDAKVLVEYVPQFVEYKAYPILGLSELPVGPTNKKYTADTKMVLDTEIEGNVTDGFTAVIANIQDTKVKVENGEHAANQILITKITIQVPVKQGDSVVWKDIFVRIYR